MAAADPRARYPSDPYDPTGSKLYTTPLPVIKNGHIKHQTTNPLIQICNTDFYPRRQNYVQIMMFWNLFFKIICL